MCICLKPQLLLQLLFSQLAWVTDVVLEVEFVDASAACSASPAAAATAASPAAAVTPASPAVKTSVAEPGSPVGAVLADSTNNGNGIPSLHLTITRTDGKPVTGSLSTATKLGELLAMWAQGQGLALEVLQVFHQGTAVDRGCWGRSFAELGCDSSLVLDVQVQAHQQPVADADAGPAQQPDVVSQGEQQQLHSCGSPVPCRIMLQLYVFKSCSLGIFFSF